MLFRGELSLYRYGYVSARCRGCVQNRDVSRNASALLNFLPHIVGNGFIRSACRGFACTETYNRREKMLKLREELLAVEEDRIAGRIGCTIDELDAYLDDVIAGV